MSNKEILFLLLKSQLDERISQLEKKNKTEEDSLKITKKSYEGLDKIITDLIKLREDKKKKDKEEEEKKLSKLIDVKNKKKENTVKSGRRSLMVEVKERKINRNHKKSLKSIGKNEKNIVENKVMKENKLSTASKKKNSIRKNESNTRLNTEINNTHNINNNILLRRNTIGGGRNSSKRETRKSNENSSWIKSGRNSEGNRRSIQLSKSVGKSNCKISLKKKNFPDIRKSKDGNNKNNTETIQDLVNKISIKVKEEEEKKIDKENIKENTKIEVKPPNLLTVIENGIIEKYILPYLTMYDQINLSSCNKLTAPLAIGVLRNKLSFYKNLFDISIGETIEDKIKNLSNKYSLEELNAPIKEFEMSRGCTKAIALLDDELYLRVFTRPLPEKILDEIYIVYQLFCQLLKKEEFVKIKDKKIFWEKFSVFILENKGEKLSDYCVDCANQFIFDKKNVLKLKEISKNWSEKLKPSYYGKICGTTGLIIFLVKDSLEYCGAIEDKKTQPGRIKENLEYYKSLLDDLNKFISFLNNLSPRENEKQNLENIEKKQVRVDKNNTP